MSLTWPLLWALLQVTAVGSAEAELLGLEKTWNEAQVHADAATLEAVWADDLVVTVPKMAVLSRADSIAILRSGRIKFDKYETSGVQVRLYGDTALVTGRLERVRQRGGQVAEDHWQFTKVYRRQDNKWRVIAFHASEAPEQ